jgi:benzoyl-CoA reductase/2-hydroxyglutaryl-CoA dehydratase subunit BcrC/BadD/HgdB
MSDSTKSHVSASAKSTQAAGEAAKLMKWWYGRVQEVKDRGGKIAWTMFVPHEICLGLDIIPFGTEQFASLCAAKQVAAYYCERAEAEGFSPDICGYCKTVVGYSARFKELGGVPPEAPYGGAPKPDMLLGRAGVICDPGFKWYQATQRYFDVPVFIFDRQPLPDTIDYEDEEIIRQYIDYELAELRRLVRFLEGQTSRKLNMDRLSERVDLSHEMYKLAYETWKLRQAVPCPMPSQDHFATVFPLLSLAGTKEAVEFFRRLRDEVKWRVDNKVGALPDEQYRLQWEGIPTWYNMGIFNYAEKYGAVFVAESIYAMDEPVEVKVSDPLERLAAYDVRLQQKLMRRLKRGTGGYGTIAIVVNSVDRMLEIARDFKIDGVVMHTMRSCRVVTIGHVHAKNVMQQKLGIPFYFLESDMVDVRAYSEAATKAGLDQFMEAVAAVKEKRLKG